MAIPGMLPAAGDVVANRGAANESRAGVIAFRDGTDRLVAPEATLARVAPFLQAMGITRVANITGLDRVGIPTVAVSRPNARSIAVSQGKGVTLNAAKASGVMESIEAFHAEHITLPLLFASHTDLLRGQRLIDVTGLAQTRFNHFHRDLRLLWVEGQELISNLSALTPLETVHTDFRVPLPPGSGAFMPSSNGLASGNHGLEAISHGICELLERDANALWRLSSRWRQMEARLRLDSVDDPQCKGLLHCFDAADIEVAIWETTSDIGVASFMCHVADRFPDPSSPMSPAYGSGCHLRREIALCRALTEAAQCRLTMISGSRDDLGSQAYGPTETAARLSRFQARFSEPAQRSFDQVSTCEVQLVDQAVGEQVTRIHRAGLRQVLVVDLTKPEFNIPVVRVVIPGLEGVSEAPGYLFGARARRCQQAAA